MMFVALEGSVPNQLLTEDSKVFSSLQDDLHDVLTSTFVGSQNQVFIKCQSKAFIAEASLSYQIVRLEIDWR